MKDSIFILINAVAIAVLFIIEKHYFGDANVQLAYISIALICTYWIVKAIENK